MRKTAIFAVAFFLAAPAGLSPAKAQAVSPQDVSDVVAHVSISKQTMTVIVDGMGVYVWPVSTARRGYVTPKGTFKVQSMHKMTYSRLFNNAPMPFTIFYDGHYGIHGTTDMAKLGQPASAGCVRLHPDNARFLFELVQKRGPAKLQVQVEG